MKRLFSASSLVSVIETARSSDRWLLRILLAGVVIAGIWFVLSLNNAASVSDVRAGGTLTEGIVGTPRFVNPVLALTRADQDVTALVYRGLLRVDSEGELVPDIASEWTMSENGTVYTFSLRDDVLFHDGTPLTATDVIFTIELVQNSELKSPLRGNWNDVSATAINDDTVELTLEEPYAPFASNLTLGILPAHIWRSIPIEQVPFSTYNTTPIGSGPYKITNSKFGANGTVSEYELEVFAGHQPQALLSELVLRFYADDAALVNAWEQGDIESSAYFPPELVAEFTAGEDYQVAEVPLTRTFGVFFNQNENVVLRDAAVREALELAIDRDEIIATSLSGAGIPSTQAINLTTPGLELDNVHAEQSTSSPDSPLELAAFVLEEAGWNLDDEGGVWEKDIDGETVPLAFTIRTVNSPVFESTLTALTDAWETLGVTVTTEQFTQSDLVQSVIRERDFDVLLFGIDPGQTQDVYPFWHSSQQDDPGLNIAQYANLTVDDALETIRTTSSSEEQTAAIATVNTIIEGERPALFLFQPTVQYVTPTELQQPLTPRFSHPSDRFNTVTSWYTERRMLWPIFTTQPEPQDLDTTE